MAEDEEDHDLLKSIYSFVNHYFTHHAVEPFPLPHAVEPLSLPPVSADGNPLPDAVPLSLGFIFEVKRSNVKPPIIPKLMRRVTQKTQRS